jgi:hypothetical protein
MENPPILSKAQCLEILEKIDHIEAEASAGRPVYKEMAERMDARRDRAAKDLIRDALE